MIHAVRVTSELENCREFPSFWDSEVLSTFADIVVDHDSGVLGNTGLHTVCVDQPLAKHNFSIVIQLPPYDGASREDSRSEKPNSQGID